jgi:5-methylcytosine-specific restriction endonuclease McrA
MFINGKERVLTSRRFCLICSPFGKGNTRSLKDLENKEDAEKGIKKCPRCKIVLPLKEFYTKKNRYACWCKKCSQEEATDRQKKFKQECINYKGGECQQCGYKKCVGAMEFHHTDPTQKDVAISRLRSYTFTERAKLELDKCELLCSNCHREKHYN